MGAFVSRYSFGCEVASRSSAGSRRGRLRALLSVLHDAMSFCIALDQRSEEHTSELQSHHDLVCRLLLEKKKKKATTRGVSEKLYFTPIFSTRRPCALPL